MYIKMAHTGGRYPSWYRKDGPYCFSFVTDKKQASDMTEEECDETLKYADWFLKLFSNQEIGKED